MGANERNVPREGKENALNFMDARLDFPVELYLVHYSAKGEGGYSNDHVGEPTPRMMKVVLA
uniref:Uncharacterized protein n=1 Tax=Candidatus Kentrum sp. TC TaxID=2126339 RepID=A0A450Y833_9GAMM|nr:MAG: hypothetical protein BECKTC1821D_GA0114238_100229 [Candidatus Kentron sp. TC]VFK53711.1 MAG: hypothetical protein BECKTC1821F_GA0114240_100326 [Candidatus Kentron sp. TC]